MASFDLRCPWKQVVAHVINERSESKSKVMSIESWHYNICRLDYLVSSHAKKLCHCLFYVHCPAHEWPNCQVCQVHVWGLTLWWEQFSLTLYWSFSENVNTGPFCYPFVMQPVKQRKKSLIWLSYTFVMLKHPTCQVLIPLVGSYTPLSYHLSQNHLMIENGTTIVLWWERKLDHNCDRSWARVDIDHNKATVGPKRIISLWATLRAVWIGKK